MKVLLALAISSCGAVADLTAAASAVDITPDPVSDSVWIAGFGLGRKATGVQDPIMSRAVVISDAKSRIALVSLDLVGLQRPVVERIRKEAGGCVDYLLVACTHNHEGPDSMGIWGETPFVSGIDEKWLERVVGAVAAQVETLAQQLRPVSIRAAQVEAPADGLVRDSRDPYVVDNTVSAFQLLASEDLAVATVVNWACHPETLWSRNTLLSADYPGALCRRLEDRFGGTAVFFSGALGGMMTPDHRKDEAGEKQATVAEASRIGRAVADLAGDALQKAARTGDPVLSWKTREILVACGNRRFHLAMGLKTLQRDIFTRKGEPWTGKISLKRLPRVKTEVGILRIGPVMAALIPGEAFPELVTGGYDGSKAFGHEVVKKDNPDPPDLDAAPKGPFLRDLMVAPVEFVIGLANDELGYFVPRYDFRINEKSASMEPKPPGDHYEETNSLGEGAAEVVMEALAELLK